MKMAWWMVALVLAWPVMAADPAATRLAETRPAATEPALTPTQVVWRRYLEACRAGDAAGAKACLLLAAPGNPKLAPPERVFEVTQGPPLAQLALLRAATARWDKNVEDLLPLEDPEAAVRAQLAQVPRMLEHRFADGVTAKLILPAEGAATQRGGDAATQGEDEEPPREVAILFRRPGPEGEWKIVASSILEPLSVAECEARAPGSRAAVQVFTELREAVQAGRIKTVDELVQRTRQVTEELLNPATEPAGTRPASAPRAGSPTN